MHIEFNSNARREGLTFEFPGFDILPKVRDCLAKYKEQENDARSKFADLLKDPSVNQNDQRFKDLRAVIEKSGREAEVCLALIVGLRKDPGKMYVLGIADIIYFGLGT